MATNNIDRHITEALSAASRMEAMKAVHSTYINSGTSHPEIRPARRTDPKVNYMDFDDIT